MLIVNRNPAKREIRSLGLLLLGASGVLGCLLWHAGRAPGAGWAWAGTGRQAAALVMWAAGFCSATLCLACLGWGRRIYVGWMIFGACLGVVVTAVLLTVLFFLFLPFFGLIRLSDPLRRRMGANSYWEPHRPHEATLERMARMF